MLFNPRAKKSAKKIKSLFFLVFILFCSSIPNLSAEQLKLTSTNTLLTSLITLAQDQGLYEQAGIELELTSKETGEMAIRSLLDQRADIAVVATAPFVKHALKNPNLRLIASIGHSDNEIKIAARRDHGISGPDDLRGRRIGTQPGVAFHLFLERLLVKHGMTEDDITPIFMPAARLPAALANGLIDAMSFSGPDLSHSIELHDKNLIIISEPGMYTMSFNLVTTDEFLQTTRAKTLIPFLQALHEAEKQLSRQPDKMTALISKRLEQPTENLRFQLSMDSQLQFDLETIALWLQTIQGNTEGKPINFLPYLHPSLLATVNPHAVRLTQWPHADLSQTRPGLDIASSGTSSLLFSAPGNTQ